MLDTSVPKRKISNSPIPDFFPLLLSSSLVVPSLDPASLLLARMTFPMEKLIESFGNVAV
jgi:hypothetical protein